MDYTIKQTSNNNIPAHKKEGVLQIAKNEIDILIRLNEMIIMKKKKTKKIKMKIIKIKNVI